MINRRWWISGWKTRTRYYCKERGVLRKIGLEKTAELVSALMEKGEVFAPVADAAGLNFQKIQDPGDVTLDFYNTLQSPKSVFFPQTDDMVRYRIAKGGPETVEVPLDFEQRIILGVRPCDVRSFEVMDRLFVGGGIVDPYWENRRKNTTIIGYAFDRVEPTDFYTTFGIGAADPGGSDIFMVRNETLLLLKGITEKGEKLLNSIQALEDASAEDEERFEERITEASMLKTRILATAGATEKLEKVFEDPYWMRAAAACLNCGVCTFVCPTCHCFDIQDEVLFGKGARKRIWDSCMFTDFTLHTSGHNPRTTKSQRLRQRINHKFSYYVTNCDVISCVGCGRCVRSCPVHIDIVAVVEGAMALP
jgi:sulfhydrogenase subunit beta (sulfur reductase)